MKNIFTRLRSKGVALNLAIVSAAMIASTAHAEDAGLPSWATSMIADASSQVTAVFAAIGPVVGIAIGAGLVIKLVKRGASKI